MVWALEALVESEMLFNDLCSSRHRDQRSLYPYRVVIDISLVIDSDFRYDNQ